MRRKRSFGCWALAGAAAAALVLVPSAGSANGDPLILGSTTNSATATTLLTTTGGLGLYVFDSFPGAIALEGVASAGTGAGKGVYGGSSSGGTDAAGVFGQLTSTAPGSGTGFSTSAGVRGVSASATGFGPGVYGLHYQGSGSAPGVMGESASGSADAAGVYGTISSNAANAAGVRGYNGGASCCGMGVAGFHAGQGIGVYGEAQNGFAVSGFSPNNWAGYFHGSVNVVGTLYKSSGAFRIDNPIDPAHSYLQHSFVESPDMKNVYDGNVTTNGKGFATVKLPDWFQALNKEFRYQLTVMGRSFAQAIVWSEIQDNRFTIKTNQPKVKLSWQVTGIRKDRYANAHRIQTVVPKSGSADNKYVHPGLYGKPLSKSVVVLPGMDGKGDSMLAPASRGK